MDGLLESLAQWHGHLIAGLLALALLQAILLAVLWRRATSQQRLWRTLLEGVKPDNLERLLLQHLRERMEMGEDLGKVTERVGTLESEMLSAKRFVGLVRYDAFSDVGGNQSFALAVYDAQGNGAVITSLVGRQDCRVYCKPLINGRSERDLSQEEQRAIYEAKNGGPKTIVSR